jgi:hypothetical protein
MTASRPPKAGLKYLPFNVVLQGDHLITNFSEQDTSPSWKVLPVKGTDGSSKDFGHIIKSLWAGNCDWAMSPVKSKNDLLCDIPSCWQEAYLSGESYRLNALINEKGYGS